MRSSVLFWRLVWLIAIVVAVVGAAAVSQLVPNPSNNVLLRYEHCNPGPWGDLTRQHIHLGLMEDDWPAEYTDIKQPTWILPKYDEGRVRQLFDQAGLPAEIAARLRSNMVCDQNGAQISPPFESVLELQSSARKVIYEELARYPANDMQAYGERFGAERFDKWLHHSGLQPATSELIERLSYKIDNFWYFSDLPALFSRIASIGEKRRVLNSLIQPKSLLVTLYVTEGMDVGSLANYWGRGRKNVDSFLRALASEPGGAAIDIVHLLPPGARNLLYRYPTVDDQEFDCMWTAFNFFNEKADNRFLDSAYNNAYFKEHYRFIPMQDMRLGDLILLGNSSDQFVHAAVYIADDVVFTKNGKSRMRPWKLTSLQELRAKYFRQSTIAAARRIDMPEKTAAGLGLP